MLKPINPMEFNMKKNTQTIKKATLSQAAKQMKQINLNAAGIDIGSSEHFVAVPKGRSSESVRSFSSFTEDLHEMVQWLKECKVDTVAMESTGVYWIPLYELLEENGFEVLLVNARHLKNVRGRKTDVQDCQWIQELHSFGLLHGSFRPEGLTLILRSYLRQRQILVQEMTPFIQRMQKSLSQMNIQLHNVIRDITGMTGMKIIRSILKGERNPEKLASYRDARCFNSKEVIAKSLQGNFREEHLFALKQAVEFYDFFQKKIEACDRKIEETLLSFDDASSNTEEEKKNFLAQ